MANIDKAIPADIAAWLKKSGMELVAKQEKCPWNPGNTPITKAVISTRASTDKQEKSGHGKAAQIAACLAYCKANHLEILEEVHDPAISGAKPIEKRDGLMRAIKRVHETPGTILVVYSFSRASRSVPDMLRLVDPVKGYGVPIVSVTERIDTSGPMGRVVLTILAALNQMERELVGERTKAAMQAAREKGVRMGAPSLVERVRQEVRVVDGKEKTIGVREIDPEKLAAVVSVRALHAELVAAGRRGSCLELTNELNARGVPSVTGKRWHRATVAAALEVAA